MVEGFKDRPNLIKKEKNRVRIFLVLISGAVFACSVAVWAWFFYIRKVAGVAEIADPTAIYINAGNMENHRYINLSGIDLDASETYKDYVFCVRGTDVTAYKLQLAYTTNNQFDYYVYPAEKLASGAPAPANDGSVRYITHPDSGSPEQQIYYISSGQSYLAGHFLNKDSEILADSSKHALTYEGYDVVNQYAEPLYWQADNPIPVTEYFEGTNDFCDYYILRVSWAAAKAAGRVTTNKRETDILYIAAKISSLLSGG